MFFKNLKYWNYKTKFATSFRKSPFLLIVDPHDSYLIVSEKAGAHHHKVFWNLLLVKMAPPVTWILTPGCLFPSKRMQLGNNTRTSCFKITIFTVWWKCNDGSVLLVIVVYPVTVVLQGMKAVGGKWGGCGHPIKKHNSCPPDWGCFSEKVTSCWDSPQSSVYFSHGIGGYPVPSSPSSQQIFTLMYSKILLIKNRNFKSPDFECKCNAPLQTERCDCILDD